MQTTITKQFKLWAHVQFMLRNVGKQISLNLVNGFMVNFILFSHFSSAIFSNPTFIRFTLACKFSLVNWQPFKSFIWSHVIYHVIKGRECLQAEFNIGLLSNKSVESGIIHRAVPRNFSWGDIGPTFCRQKWAWLPWLKNICLHEKISWKNLTN